MVLPEDAASSDRADAERPATRVDAAHGPHCGGPTTAAVPAAAIVPAEAPQPTPRETLLAVTGRSPVHAPMQLQMQAAQLGDQLKRRQDELDRREAHLNAEAAELENELRLARLWLREQRDELDRRETELQERSNSLDEQAARNTTLAEAHAAEAAAREIVLAEQEAALSQKGASLRNWESQLQRDVHAIRQREKHVDDAEAALSFERQRFQAEQQAMQEMHALAAANLEKHRAALQQREAALDARLRGSYALDRLDEAQQALDLRRLRLEEAEQLLAAHRDELDQQRRQLADDRADLARRIAEQNAAWDERAKEAEQQWRRRRESLSRRVEHLEHRRKAVESLHAEALEAHRETLEMRLAIEQLWLELQGKRAPAALTQSLAEARRKLAEHAQRSAATLTDQREELQSLSTRLALQHDKLRQQREDLDRTAAARHREMEEQAAWLVSREQDLDRQERDFREAKRRWAEEKCDLQRRLREALSHSLRTPLAA